MNGALRRSGNQALRALILLVVIAASGVGLGLAAGYPVSRIEFQQSDAVRIDHTRLAGQIDPADAVATQSDLTFTWTEGDPAVGAFGLLGLDFCGEKIALPASLSGREVSVFASTGDSAFLISEAIRVDRLQSARAYVDDVADALDECTEFYRTGLEGTRTKVEIHAGMGSAPITDHVARVFVSEDGTSVQAWSIMAVGDVIIALQHIGPQRPQEGFLSDVENKILMRIDPADFAPGGIAQTTTTDPQSTSTSVLTDGAADETEQMPGTDDTTGTDDTVNTDGAADESGTGD